MDPTLVNAVNVFDGLREGGVVVLNDRRMPEEVELPPGVQRLGVLDATSIAIEVLGSPITNTSMLGAFAATTGWVGLDALIAALKEVLKGKSTDLNAKAAIVGYQRTRVLVRG